MARRLGWLATVILGALLAFGGLVSREIGPRPLVSIVVFFAGLGLLSIALMRFWPDLRGNRAALVGLSVVALWAALRFIAPPLLGWPTVTCSPEPPPTAGCNLSVNNPGIVWFLLPMTEVTINGYGQCEGTVVHRYLGGAESTTTWIC